MKRIRLKDAGIDICVTIDVKTIYTEKASGDVRQELERLETARIVKNIAARHEGPLAREIAIQAKKKIESP